MISLETQFKTCIDAPNFKYLLTILVEQKTTILNKNQKMNFQQKLSETKLEFFLFS